MKQQWVKKVFTILISMIGLYAFVLLFFGLPIPRGSKVNSNYYTYYRNFRGIYYISVKSSFELINHGSWGYLKDVDEATFTILSDSWSKDATHVWFGDNLIKNVDVATFHINASGVAVDKDNVYIKDYSSSDWFVKPSQSGIDVETAEYFVYRLGERQDQWMLDKDYVYHYDKRIAVDRNTFKIIGEDWFIDRYNVYLIGYNRETEQWNLCCIDSTQYPVEPGYYYFRNGRNVLYFDSVIVRDIDVKRFEEIGNEKYLVNDMLFFRGKPFLKDSLDVRNAQFYFYGRIAADKKNVFFDNNRLDDVDAATFRQINDETFEDKNYIYTIKEKVWEDYKNPFDKKKK